MAETPSNATHNQLTFPGDAVEYMDGLGGEIVTEHLTIGWANLPKYPDEPSEDTVYAYFDEQSGNAAFSVWDGLGGHEDGRAAAVAAMQVFHEETVGGQSAELSDLFSSMSAGVGAVTKRGGCTVIAGLLEPQEDGRWLVPWGAVGDSLMFLIRDGQITEINREETVRQNMLDAGAKEADADMHGNVLTNALGRDYTGLHEQGALEVKESDILLLVSDGITGDRADQRLRGGENNLAVIQHVMMRTDLSARQKAEYLIELATKFDDRTALVVEVGKPKVDQAATTEDDVIDLPPDHNPPRAPGRNPAAPPAETNGVDPVKATMEQYLNRTGALDALRSLAEFDRLGPQLAAFLPALLAEAQQDSLASDKDSNPQRWHVQLYRDQAGAQRLSVQNRFGKHGKSIDSNTTAHVRELDVDCDGTGKPVGEDIRLGLEFWDRRTVTKDREALGVRIYYRDGKLSIGYSKTKLDQQHPDGSRVVNRAFPTSTQKSMLMTDTHRALRVYSQP